MSNREIAVLIALAIPLAGLLIEYIRTQLRLRDFRDIGRDLKTLRVSLGGNFDRDGEDLLLRGSYGQWPVLVRLSRSEYEAGVTVELPVPNNLTLFCYPVSHEGQEGQVPLRTSDERFMSRFRLSTNNSPLEVSMILSSPAVLAEFSKITESKTRILLENRILELSEPSIPEQLAARIINCVRGMARIASEANEVHGGSGSVPAPPKREQNWFRIGYVGVSVLILLVLLVAQLLNRPSKATVVSPVTSTGSASIPASLAAQVPQLQGWHVAETKDFDSDAVAWMQQQGQRTSGQISASLNSEQSSDSAYIFKRQPGPPGTNSARFVLFINNQKRYDAEMPEIDAAGRVSRGSINSAEWRGRGPSSAPNGDGIIVIQRYNDPTSAIVFFMSGPKLLTAVPKDFHSISLE